MEKLGLMTTADVKSVLGKIKKRLASRRQTFVLLQGPVGSGKIMVARRLAALVPAPKQQDLDTLGAFYERVRGGAESVRAHGPFRAPHYTISQTALVGMIQRGGLYPGELSLAHAGTLLLDEAEEFRRMELREIARVLKAGVVVFHVKAEALHERSITVPARPALVILTALPCPCGRMPKSSCTCSQGSVERFTARLGETFSVFPIDYVLGVNLLPDAHELLSSMASQDGYRAPPSAP